MNGFPAKTALALLLSVYAPAADGEAPVLFKNAKNGDFRLRNSSPLLGSGLYTEEMASLLDLAGAPLPRGRLPLMPLGCFAAGVQGTAIMLR